MHPEPSEWVRRWSHLIAPDATVLDVACGSGRHMAWFASRGHKVLGLDRDPSALASGRAFGAVLLCDLEAASWPLDQQEFGAVIVTNYLCRPLLPRLVNALAPGGVMLYETFADGQQTIGRPANPDFLLQPGELLDACSSLQVVAYEQGCLPSPMRFVQRIAAVRPHEGADPMAQRMLNSPSMA